MVCNRERFRGIEISEGVGSGGFGRTKGSDIGTDGNFSTLARSTVSKSRCLVSARLRYQSVDQIRWSFHPNLSSCCCRNLSLSRATGELW